LGNKLIHLRVLDELVIPGIHGANHGFALGVLFYSVLDIGYKRNVKFIDGRPNLWLAAFLLLTAKKHRAGNQRKKQHTANYFIHTL
jgi:hypothetical protein